MIAETAVPATPQTTASEAKFFVGITSCPTGIAHTFMAAEALKQGAAKLGHDIKVETQGSVGSQNALTAEEIARADAVIIAADTHAPLGLAANGCTKPPPKPLSTAALMW